MKTPVRISVAVSTCLIAMSGWSDQAQDAIPGEVTEENPVSQKHTTHPVYPGIDHQDFSHQVVSNALDGVIDACSLVCLSCHDGINASETRIKTVGEWEGLFGYGNLSHPLGIDYSMAFARNSGLKPSIFLPSEIILPEGKVGCESCHNLYSTMPYFLILGNQDSALCLGCHDK